MEITDHLLSYLISTCEYCWVCVHNSPVSSTMGQLLMSTAAAASLDFSSFIIAWVVRMHTDLLTFNTETYSVTAFSICYITICCQKKKKKEKVVYFNQCNNSVLPQQSFWRWAAWSPGSGGAVVWQWRAHSQRTGIRRRWQSGRFLFSDSRITPKQCKESQS